MMFGIPWWLWFGLGVSHGLVAWVVAAACACVPRVCDSCRAAMLTPAERAGLRDELEARAQGLYFAVNRPAWPSRDRARELYREFAERARVESARELEAERDAAVRQAEEWLRGGHRSA